MCWLMQYRRLYTVNDLVVFSCIFVFFLFWAVNEIPNKKEEVQTRITNIFHVFLLNFAAT